jgi:hypothetical protein
MCQAAQGSVCTYSLGFFFGPGRPRSLMGPFGSMDGGARFLPLTWPPPRFRLSPALGGASELLSVTSVVVGGMGVELDSDDFSAGSGACMEGVGSALGGVVDDLGVLSDGYCESWSGDRRRTTTRLFLPAVVLGVALAVLGVVADMVDDVGVCGSMVGDGVGRGDDGVGKFRPAARQRSQPRLWNVAINLLQVSSGRSADSPCSLGQCPGVYLLCSSRRVTAGW